MLEKIVEQLEELDTASIDVNTIDGKNLAQIAINCFRILAASEKELYNSILKDGLGEETLSFIVELHEKN